MYSVKLSGVGDPPEGREEVGHCSQMALFTRDDSDICATNTVGTPYNIVSVLSFITVLMYFEITLVTLSLASYGGPEGHSAVVFSTWCSAVELR